MLGLESWIQRDTLIKNLVSIMAGSVILELIRPSSMGTN